MQTAMHYIIAIYVLEYGSFLTFKTWILVTKEQVLELITNH